MGSSPIGSTKFKKKMKKEINLKYNYYGSYRDNAPEQNSLIICSEGLCELVGNERFDDELYSDEIKIVVSDKNPKKKGWKKISITINKKHIESVSFLSTMTNKKVRYVDYDMYTRAKDYIYEFLKGSLKKIPKNGNHNIWIKIEAA